jgi:hypothetical protein
MDIIISRPSGYSEGAYHLVATLNADELKDYDVIPIVFEIPTLAHRFIHTRPDYFVAVSDLGGTKLRGMFLEGCWECDVYSNGVSEKKNTTPIAEVEERVKQSINSALGKIKGLSSLK